MARSVLETARILIRRRKFNYAIILLESYVHNYKGSFEYYLALGTACLYIGDEGNAFKYYQLAREIKINNSELLLGQAAIYLRRGESSKALRYYLDILDTDPSNEVARNALEFIRFNGENYNLICQLKDNGKIENFYPPLGFNPDIIRNSVLIGLLIGVIISVAIVLIPKLPHSKVNWKGPRRDVQKLELTQGEQSNPISSDLDAASTVRYMLDSATVTKSYESAVDYFQNHRDNAARVEINRIVNSNAAISVKQKAVSLRAYLEDETFDTLIAHAEDNYPVEQVQAEPALYAGCFVSWKGRIADAHENADGSWQCLFLVGYDTLSKVEGEPLQVVFAVAPKPPVDEQKPIRILGVVLERGGKVTLEGKSYYQPVRGTFDD